VKYQAYGCHIEADRRLPGLLPASSSKMDIVVTFDTSRPLACGTGQVVHCGSSVVVWRTDIGHYFAYEDNTEFLVSPAGDQIFAFMPLGATLEDTCTYLIGPVMGFVLRLHGLVCLHASTVVIGGRAVAFCGSPGAGKSTTAAAFAQRGYPVLAEDVAALDDRGSFCIRPGYPRVNLWPDSAAALWGSPDALPAITPNWEKRYVPLGNIAAQFHTSPAPLAAVYVIGGRSRQPKPEIQPLQSVEALIALAANTYTPYLLDRVMRAREFDVLTHLVRHVPVRRVLPPADIANIGGLCDGLLKDYESLC
jgi:hypothetical protein